MFVSVIIIWIFALIVSVLFIQPSLDSWGCLPQILSGNASYTFISSKLPNIALWGLLVIALLLWSVLTVFLYVIIKFLEKMKKKNLSSN